MSFNAKNLTYEKKEPTFLRRLRQQSGRGDPARQEHPLGRQQWPKRLQIGGDDDDEDGPTYVDEDTNEVVSRDEYRARLDDESGTVKPAAHDTTTGATGLDVKGEGPEKAEAPQDEVEEVVEKIADIGNRQKKRAAKVIASDADDAGKPTGPDEPQHAASKKSGNRSRKKRRIQLSFDDEDIQTES
ncbi:MAG: hypothetical protein M1815_001886 [Lichina confinis]|nr:MAG: hypothetical protein M1815_001886 [Lichina confinis]